QERERERGAREEERGRERERGREGEREESKFGEKLKKRKTVFSGTSVARLDHSDQINFTPLFSHCFPSLSPPSLSPSLLSPPGFTSFPLSLSLSLSLSLPLS